MSDLWKSTSVAVLCICSVPYDRRLMISGSDDVRQTCLPFTTDRKQVPTCLDLLYPHIYLPTFPRLPLRSRPQGRPSPTSYTHASPKYHVFTRDSPHLLRLRSDAYTPKPPTSSSRGCRRRCAYLQPISSIARVLTTSQRSASPPSYPAAPIFKTTWTTIPIGHFF